VCGLDGSAVFGSDLKGLSWNRATLWFVGQGFPVSEPGPVSPRIFARISLFLAGKWDFSRAFGFSSAGNGISSVHFAFSRWEMRFPGEHLAFSSAGNGIFLSAFRFFSLGNAISWRAFGFSSAGKCLFLCEFRFVWLENAFSLPPCSFVLRGHRLSSY